MTKEIKEKIVEMKWDGFNLELAEELSVTPTHISQVFNYRSSNKRVWIAAFYKLKQKYQELSQLEQAA